MAITKRSRWSGINQVQAVPKSTLGQNFSAGINKEQTERTLAVVFDALREKGVMDDGELIKEEDWKSHKYYRQDVNGNAQLEWSPDLTLSKARAFAETFDIDRRYDGIANRSGTGGSIVRWTGRIGAMVFGDEVNYIPFLGWGLKAAKVTTGTYKVAKKVLGTKKVRKINVGAEKFKRKIDIRPQGKWKRGVTTALAYGGAYGAGYTSALNPAMRFRNKEELTKGELALAAGLATVAPAGIVGVFSALGPKVQTLATQIARKKEATDALKKSIQKQATQEQKPKIETNTKINDAEMAEIKLKQEQIANGDLGLGTILIKDFTTESRSFDINNIQVKPKFGKSGVGLPNNARLQIFANPDNPKQLVIRARSNDDARRILNILKIQGTDAEQVVLKVVFKRNGKRNKEGAITINVADLQKAKTLTNILGKETTSSPKSVKTKTGDRVPFEVRKVGGVNYRIFHDNATGKTYVQKQIGKNQYADLNEAQTKTFLTKQLMDNKDSKRIIENNIEDNPVDNVMNTELNVTRTVDTESPQVKINAEGNVEVVRNDKINVNDGLAFGEMGDLVLNNRELNDAWIKNKDISKLKFEKTIGRQGGKVADRLLYYTKDGQIYASKTRNKKNELVKTNNDLNVTSMFKEHLTLKYKMKATKHMKDKGKDYFNCVQSKGY